jgi:hypothetical protein
MRNPAAKIGRATPPTLEGSGNVIKIPVPRVLRGSAFALYGSGGPGRLLSRLAWEDRLGSRMPDPLSRSELASLLSLFADEPLPRALRGLITARLTSEARVRAGRKPRRLTTYERAQGDLLPIFYRHALQWARAERRRRIAEANRTRRGPSPDSVPPATELACYRIRQQLPRFKDMTTGAILNEVSRAKPRQDTPPRKAQRRVP